MKNLAPDIIRQRLLIEANYNKSLTKQDVETYLRELPRALDLRIYTDPIVYSPGGEGKEVNQGYDGFVALIDSGIAIYVWESAKFLSLVIYTCKQFSVETAIAFTKEYFQTAELEQASF